MCRRSRVLGLIYLRQVHDVEVSQSRIRSINLVSCLFRLPFSSRLISFAFPFFLSFPVAFYDFFGFCHISPCLSPFLCRRLLPPGL